MVFRVHHEGSLHPKLTPAASSQVNGCVFALTVINGMIAAGVNSSVRFKVYMTRLDVNILEGNGLPDNCNGQYVFSEPDFA